MPNNNVAILSLMAKFDEKSVDDAAKRLGKKTDEVLSNISDDKFSEKIVAQFDKALKTLQGSKFKKANLSPYTNGLLDVLVSDKAITEKEKALQDFSKKIISLSKSLSGLGDNALNSLSEKQLNSIIAKQEKISKKNDEIQKKTLELDNRAKNIGKQKNNISTISKNYGESDSTKLTDTIKNNLKTNNEFNDSQIKSIGYLSKLLSLYSDMENIEPEKGTADAIKYSRDLLSVVNEIKKEASKIDLFSNGKASKYIKDNYNSLDSVNQYTLISSQNDYVNKGLTSLKGQEAKLQKELTQYISDSVQKNLQKITTEVGQTIEKAEKKVENLDNKINTLKDSSSKNIKSTSSEVDEKSLQEIEDRLYELHDKYTGENQDNSQIIDLDIKELKEYISLYKEYLKLTSSSNYQADPIFTETYNMMLENDIELQNYSKKIDKAIQKEKELKEASKTESDTNTSSDLSNNGSIVINVNSEQALENISKVKTSLNELPDKKDISINIKSDDYSSVSLLSDEEGKVVDAFRGVRGSWAGLINRDDITFFTDKMSLAADYADDMAQSGKVYKANLAFANPLEVDGKGAVWDNIDFDGAKRSTNEIVDLAKQLGHDGVIFRNIRDGFTDTEEDISTVMVSLNAMQIKNAEVVASVKAGTGKAESIISSDESNDVIASQNNIQEELIETQKQSEKTADSLKDINDIESAPTYTIEQLEDGLKQTELQAEKTVDSLKGVTEAHKQMIQSAVNSIPQKENTARYVHWGSPEQSTAILSNPNGMSTGDYGFISSFADCIGEAETSMNAIVEDWNFLHADGFDKGSALIMDIPLDQVKEFEHALKDNIPQEFIKGWIDTESGAITLNNTLQTELKNTQNQAIETAESVKTVASIEPTKGAFHGEDDTSKMAEIKGSSEAAAKAKQEFVEVNKKVQESVDGSENPLKTEAHLMQEIAEAARSAADAKKEFVEANKQVKDSAEQSAISIEAEEKAIHNVTENSDNSNNTQDETNRQGELVESMAKAREQSELFRRAEERRLQLAQNDAINQNLEQEYQERKRLEQEAEKQFQEDKKRALEYSKNANKRLTNAVLEYSYGDTTEANRMAKAVNRVGVNFDGYTDVDNVISKLEERIEKIISNLKRSHEENLAALEKEIAAEEEAQKKADSEKEKSNTAEYQKQYEIIKKLYDTQTELNNLKASNKNGKYDKDISNLEGSLSELKQSAEVAADAINNMYNVDSGDALITEKQFVDAIRLAGKAAEGSANSYKKLNIARKDAILNSVSSYRTKIDKYSSRENQSKTYNSNLTEMKAAYEELCNLSEKLASSQIVSDEDNSRAKELLSTLEKCDNALKLMPSNSKGSSPISRDKLYGKLSDYASRNSGIDKSFKDEIKAMQKLLKSMGADANVSNIADQFENLKTRIREAGQEGKSFLDAIKDKAWYGLAAQIGNFFSLNDFVNVIRQAADNVVNLNTKLTDLAKVSDASISELYSDFNSYADIAKEIGGTISDTIDATAAWSKNGYNLPDSKELAKVALLYKNVGDSIDIDTANESLISTLKGFKLEAEDAMHIIDVFNEVSNNEAISSAGIGTALQRSAASFNAANTSLEQSVALVTATNSVLQDEEKTGNMWKTVSARLRGAKTEIQEMGEDTDGMVESTSKLQSLIKGMTGFDILENDGKTFKDIYTIVLNIGKVWDKLSDIDQAALLEALAGKNQSNALAAALSNIDVLEKSYKEAMNSSGSAMNEQEKYQESIQYSIDKTKASLEELSNDLINSKFLKTLIKGGDILINFLDTIIDKFGILSTLIAGGGLSAIILDFG